MLYIKAFLKYFTKESPEKEAIVSRPTPEEYAELLRKQIQPSLAELYLTNRPIHELVSYCMEQDDLITEIKEQVKLLFFDEQIAAKSNLQLLWMEGFPKFIIRLSQLSAQEIIKLEPSGWRFVIKHFPDLPSPKICFRFKYYFSKNDEWSFHDFYEEIDLDSELGNQLLNLRPWHEWIHRVWEEVDEEYGSEMTITPPAKALSLFSRTPDES